DFARVIDEPFLVVTSEGQDLFYYYAVQVKSLLSDSPARLICAVLTFIWMFVVIERYSLKTYTVEEFESIVPAEEREDDDQEPVVAPLPRTQQRGIRGLITTILDPDRSLVNVHEMRPGERARFVLGFLMCLLVIVVYVYETDNSAALSNDGRQLLNFILEGNWKRGPNIFALSSILIMCSGALLLVSACRWTLNILSSFLESKGKTICRLLNNFVGYLTLAVVIYFSLSYLGIPAGTVIGSLGLSGLALTFGAREIIADILSGISIIFEGDYQVGDIVEIDGFRGTVKEISVRATHILNAEGNYKIVRNMDIRKLTNMSKRHSHYALSIVVPYSESLTEVEKKLVAGLSGIAPHPKVITGPTYVGVTSIAPDKMTLLIDAECLERDMNAVTLYLNREIRLMLERQGINAK
ncbi:MAG: mechanosensitive ion channel, partial [Atopobiaceae bacterium]|nr:mechanosensitive ion channel [Atopobiaceae bacterium]